MGFDFLLVFPGKNSRRDQHIDYRSLGIGDFLFEILLHLYLYVVRGSGFFRLQALEGFGDQPENNGLPAWDLQRTEGGLCAIVSGRRDAGGFCFAFGVMGGSDV